MARAAKSESTGQEAIAHHAMVPRLGVPGETYELRNALGVEASVTADKKGIVRPSRLEEVRAADAFGLPTAPGTYTWRESARRPVETGTFEQPPEWLAPASASEASETPVPTKKELLARAAELGLEVPARATVAQISEAIAEAESEEADESAEES